MSNNNEKIIQSVDRAIQIIKCFENNEELGVTEIGKLLGLHKSTTFGLVSTLYSNGLLEKNDNTGKYKLGLELFRLGTKVNSSLRHIVIPYLEELVRRYQETANLILLDDLSVIYLEKVESAHSMRISTLVGGRRPLYCTAVGKAILAYLPPEELQNKINRIEFIKFTNNTILTQEALIESLNEIKTLGYAEDNEELEIGLSCIAAPILNQYKSPFAAISVSGPTSRMNDGLRKEIGMTLVEFTQDISKKLGFI